MEELTTKTVFGFDGLEDGLYHGFKIIGENWNGFELPLLQEEQVREFVKDMKVEDTTEYNYTRFYFDGEILKVEYIDPCENPTRIDVEKIEHETIKYKGEKIKVWNVGCGLCWSEFSKDYLNECVEDIEELNLLLSTIK